jgi:hypothetical protein
MRKKTKHLGILWELVHILIFDDLDEFVKLPHDYKDTDECNN